MDNNINDLKALFKEALPQITLINKDVMLEKNKQWRNNIPNSNYVALLHPRNEKELRDIFKICADNNIGVVPRAGGTALTNGSTIAPENAPYQRSKECVLVQPKFPRKLDITQKDGETFVTVSPNITAKDIENSLSLTGQYKVPVDLGIGSKEGIATIVGYLANNAAGTGAAFHGRAIDMVENVKAIKADGRAWHMDKNDPHLSELIGMGGTTGFITEATIKLQSIRQNQAVMALRLNNTAEMYNLLEACKGQCWDEMQMFERVNDNLFQEVAHQLGRKNHRFTTLLNNNSEAKGDLVFIQLGSNEKNETDLRKTLKDISKTLNRDITPIIPISEEDQEFLLNYRVVNASLACENYVETHGGKVVAFDISVPPSDDAPFPSNDLISSLEEKFSGIKIFSFGHAAGVEKISSNSPPGGTALHFNPILPEEISHREGELRAMVFEEVSRRGGKIVSEHAVGTKLVADSQHYTPQEYAYNLDIIKKHDPQNILNPGAFVANYN